MSKLTSHTGGEIVAFSGTFVYVNEAENSDKWWKAQVEKRNDNTSTDWFSVIVMFGRTGTEGQIRLKHYASEKLAIRYMNLKVKEKLAKGYTLEYQQAVKGTPKSALKSMFLANVGDSILGYAELPAIKHKKKPPIKKPVEPKGRRIILD